MFNTLDDISMLSNPSTQKKIMSHYKWTERLSHQKPNLKFKNLSRNYTPAEVFSSFFSSPKTELEQYLSVESNAYEVLI